MSERTDLTGLLPDQPVTVGPDSPVAEHIRAGLDSRLRTWIAHDSGTRLGTDPEDLHQLRVTVRRIRSMIKAGRPFLDPAWYRPVLAELGWLGRALGPVRDLDVLLARLDRDAIELGHRPALAGLIAGLESERAEARETMLAALDSERYSALVTDLADSATRPLPLSTMDESTADGDATPRGLVLAQFRKLRKAVRRAGADADDDQLHSLRIRGKRLRYTAELAAPESNRHVPGLLAAAKKFQDVLGEHQDARIAGQRVHDLLYNLGDHADTAVAYLAGRLVEREHTRRATAREQWWPAWQTLREAANRI